MLILHGSITVKPEFHEKMAEMATTLTEHSILEPGCLTYRFLQDALQKDRFVFLEKWRSQEDLDQHFQKPYFLEFAEALPQLISEKPVIETHEVASSRVLDL